MVQSGHMQTEYQNIRIYILPGANPPRLYRNLSSHKDNLDIGTQGLGTKGVHTSRLDCVIDPGSRGSSVSYVSVSDAD